MPDRFSHFSIPNFRVPTIASINIVGDLGEPLEHGIKDQETLEEPATVDTGRISDEENGSAGDGCVRRADNHASESAFSAEVKSTTDGSSSNKEAAVVDVQAEEGSVSISESST